MDALVGVKRRDGMESSWNFSDADKAAEFYRALCAKEATKRAWLMVGTRIVRSYALNRGELMQP